MQIRRVQIRRMQIRRVQIRRVQIRRIQIRRVASALGLLNDVCKATEYGSAHTKDLGMQKIEAVRRAGSKQFEGSMYLDTESVTDLWWWWWCVCVCVGGGGGQREPRGDGRCMKAPVILTF